MMNCRHCKRPLEHIFLDLGFAPPSNRYLSARDLRRAEPYLPLRLFVCDACWLVQTEDFASKTELFDEDYAYFSSVSRSWLEHAGAYARMITRRLQLDRNSLVVEVASNDGYLLKNFVAAGIPCLGIEPTGSTAAAAEQLGIPVLREFFGEALAKRLAAQGQQADLIAGNNVYAHVPDINDFTAGLRAGLKPAGVVTLEFPHLMRLLEGTQFDTVYHEHFSYLSLTAVTSIFQQAGLRVFDVEQLPTHGGSLRVYGCRIESSHAESASVAAMIEEEMGRGLKQLEIYTAFQQTIYRIRDELLMFLIEQRRLGKTVVAYGAAAKGNTLLNYAGVKPDLLPYVCDAAPSKQGKFMPGSHIPIVSPDELRKTRPDTILILPWNISDEVKQELSYVADWGGQLAVAVPTMRILR